MSGKRSRVAKQIKEEEPKAIYTYCFGHALNLAAGDTTKACTTLKNALDITLEITKTGETVTKKICHFSEVERAASMQCTWNSHSLPYSLDGSCGLLKECAW